MTYDKGKDHLYKLKWIQYKLTNINRVNLQDKFDKTRLKLLRYIIIFIICRLENPHCKQGQINNQQS